MTQVTIPNECAGCLFVYRRDGLIDLLVRLRELTDDAEVKRDCDHLVAQLANHVLSQSDADEHVMAAIRAWWDSPHHHDLRRRDQVLRVLAKSAVQDAQANAAKRRLEQKQEQSRIAEFEQEETNG